MCCCGGDVLDGTGSNGLISTVNYFGDATVDPTRSVIQQVSPLNRFVIEGYQGATGGNRVQWGSIQATTQPGAIAVAHTTQSGSTQSTATIDEIVAAVALGSANVTGPAFVVVPIGDGRWGGSATEHGNNASLALQAARPHGRNVHLLTPRDLGATWSRYKALAPHSQIT